MNQQQSRRIKKQYSLMQLKLYQTENHRQLLKRILMVHQSLHSYNKSNPKYMSVPTIRSNQFSKISLQCYLPSSTWYTACAGKARSLAVVQFFDWHSINLQNMLWFSPTWSCNSWIFTFNSFIFHLRFHFQTTASHMIQTSCSLVIVPIPTLF